MTDAEPWRETLIAARDEIISLLPQDWFENGFLKGPHPVIDKIDTALTAPPRSEIMETAELYAGRLHACLFSAGFEAPRQQWLAAHFRDAIVAFLRRK